MSCNLIRTGSHDSDNQLSLACVLQIVPPLCEPRFSEADQRLPKGYGIDPSALPPIALAIPNSATPVGFADPHVVGNFDSFPKRL
jgi:hypothetical protein